MLQAALLRMSSKDNDLTTSRHHAARCEGTHNTSRFANESGRLRPYSASPLAVYTDADAALHILAYSAVREGQQPMLAPSLYLTGHVSESTPQGLTEFKR